MTAKGGGAVSEDLITTHEVARILGVASDTVTSWMTRGIIPAAARGTTSEAFVAIEDWYTTFCALAGVDPADARAAAAGLPPVDGVDLSPVLLGTNATSPRTEIVIGSSDGNDHKGNTIVAGVIDGEFLREKLRQTPPVRRERTTQRL